MDFTFTFLQVFAITLYLVSPLLLFLLFLIIGIGQIIGRIENWSIFDSLYYTFITATTVGYGDYHPRHRRAKIAAIFIALIGILMTGLIVAVGLKSVEVAFTSEYNIEQIGNEIRTQLEK